MALFDRQVILEIGQPGQPGKQFRDLRISFTVDMSRSRNPNTSTIEAYNLNERSIAAAQRDGAVVRLLAGYDVPRLIFQGEAVKNGVWSEQQGPDRVLHFEGQDGGSRYRAARVDVTFSTATTLGQVLDAVTAQLGLPLGTIRVDRTIQFPQGVALRGPARDVLDRIAAAQDQDWFVRDGALQIVPRNGATGETVVELSAARGNLIGSPRAKDNGIEVTDLLEPSLRPGRRFVVHSKNFNGIYIAHDVRFRGDSGFGNDYFVTVTGREAA